MPVCGAATYDRCSPRAGRRHTTAAPKPAGCQRPSSVHASSALPPRRPVSSVPATGLDERHKASSYNIIDARAPRCRASVRILVPARSDPCALGWSASKESTKPSGAGPARACELTEPPRTPSALPCGGSSTVRRRGFASDHLMKGRRHLIWWGLAEGTSCQAARPHEKAAPRRAQD